MAKRLKVFTWSDGFHAFTVAVSSRPKALEAWGSKQDLFATGLASELSGGPDYEAALAAPGQVIERGLAIDVGKIRKADGPKKAAGPSKARRARIERLEAELETLDADHRQAMADLADRLKALEDEQAERERTHAKRRKALTAALKAARR
ncbi:hypothetical protein [Brevundimonas aurantiaca]|jgi:hypothetical protein|uniref:hypothetical protein n=1 Tax=Brevundimonas aurantiaca TaxID=74316 RepID=UPI001D18A271|nr:hypothetical protein [Brevundimonas aurantiaca]MCC4294442.1 hypothetical protein [Brevundimonas aurantiaca]MEC7796063.1 hypothetical protein [Pseudomonadota bacterium]